jgi:hypothetical protein
MILNDLKTPLLEANRILTINRVGRGLNSTGGEFYMGSTFISYTVEDVLRPGGVKIYGNTAIPAGTYTAFWRDKRDKYGHWVLQLESVPQFEGIQIHAGTKISETLGCPLMCSKLDYSSGDYTGGLYSDSRALTRNFYDTLRDVYPDGTFTVTINDPAPLS